MSLTSILLRQNLACPLASSLRSLSLSSQLDNAAAAAQSKIPKRPSPPFTMYFTESFPQARKANPDHKVPEIMKALSIKWKALPDTQKVKYVTNYEKEKAVYKTKIARVSEADLSEAGYEAAKKRATKVKNNAQSELKELLTSLKKPILSNKNGYMVYSSARQSTMKAKGITGSKAIQEIAAEWRILTDQQKQMFVKKAEAAKEKYDKDIAVWTNKMTKSGKLNMIRDAEDKLAQAKKKLKDLDN